MPEIEVKTFSLSHSHDGLYPALRRHCNLRISKGLPVVKNFRTNETVQVDGKTLLFLSLCDGTTDTMSLKEIIAGSFGKSEEETKTFLNQTFERFSDAIDFLQNPCKQTHICDIKSRMEQSLKPWPYSYEREEIPSEISLVLTERCNHQCSYCFKSSNKAQDHQLHIGDWLRVIDEAAEIGVQEIAFTGGEPTLLPEFLELVRHACAKGMYPRVFTNGTTLCGDSAARLRETGAEYIHLSLPGVSQDVFEKVTRTRGTLPKVKQVVSDLKHNGFYIRAKMVLTTENLADTASVLDFCIAQGIDDVFLAPFILTPMSRGDANLIPSTAQLVEIQKIARQRKDISSGVTVIGGPSIGDLQWRGPQNIIKCGACKERLIICSNGDITCCEALGRDRQFVLGNVRHTGIASIWYSHQPDRLISPESHPVDEPCRSCEYLNECGTGCLMFSRLYSGNYWSVDPRCFKQNIPGNVFAQRRHSPAEKTNF